jgi:type II secretory pathway component PulK
MTAADLDPAISDPPTDAALARKLAAAIPELDEEQVDAVLEALLANGYPRRGKFRRQLGHRLDQAQARRDRGDD